MSTRDERPRSQPPHQAACRQLVPAVLHEPPRDSRAPCCHSTAPKTKQSRSLPNRQSARSIVHCQRTGSAIAVPALMHAAFACARLTSARRKRRCSQMGIQHPARSQRQSSQDFPRTIFNASQTRGSHTHSDGRAKLVFDRIEISQRRSPGEARTASTLKK